MKTTISVPKPADLAALLAATSLLAPNASSAPATDHPTPPASVAGIAEEMSQLRDKVDEQGRRLDRLYRVLGPHLEEMEERAAELEKQQRDDAALAMNQLFGCRDAAFTSKLLFLPGSKSVAAAFSDGTIRVYALPAGNLERTLSGAEGRIECLAVSRDGSRLFAGTVTGYVFAWPGAEGTPTRVVDTRGWPVTALAASPDGAIVVWACNGKYGDGNKWVSPEWRLDKA